MTVAFVIEQCAHDHDYTKCQRCALSPAVSATKERCRCPKCREWRRAYNAARKPRTDRRVHPDAVPCDRLSFTVSCPRCGGAVEYLSGTEAHAYEVRAVLHCSSCHIQPVIVALMLGETGNPLRPLENR